ncbi:MFS transporter [Mycolicibacterium sp. Dal123E01]|uniref:MFS transporter n=1 Tax=Mycolicibacterium sp. Dal123E01 TaxID=3457578 RepID=UPI00403EBBA0
MSDPEAARTDNGYERPGLLIATLCVVALTVAVLQTGVVPVLGVISRQLHASPVDVSWAVTANLLAAAASTPLIGRLADLYSKKRVLLAVLAVVLVGSLLAALTSSLPLLIVARVLQGASYALYPIGVSILREELPEDRLMRAMAVLSGSLGFGGGMGLVVTGLLMRGDAGYHRVFWLTTVFTVLVIIAVLVVLPKRPRSSEGTVDWAGAAGLALGLSAVVLAITQGHSWGWASPRTIGCMSAGVVVLGLWWWWERRSRHPLVSTTMLSRRPILLTNLATVLVGTGLYFAFLGLTDFVEAPPGSGYGFGATVLGASVMFLLPGALAGFLTAVASGRYIDRYGARTVLLVGAGTGVVGFVLLAVWHDQPWQVIAAGVLANAYISLAYGALPALVVREVEADETGVATSMNAIARTIGSSIAAAIVAVLLGRSQHGHVPESSFTIIFALGAITAGAAMLLIAITRSPLRPMESEDAAQSRAMNHEWG